MTLSAVVVTCCLFLAVISSSLNEVLCKPQLLADGGMLSDDAYRILQAADDDDDRHIKDPDDENASNGPALSVSKIPTSSPSSKPSPSPSHFPTTKPSISPSRKPTISPTFTPSQRPSIIPTLQPSYLPSFSPSVEPTVAPSFIPTFTPSVIPSSNPSMKPSHLPSKKPSVTPSLVPTLTPSVTHSLIPSITPSSLPTMTPSVSNMPTPIDLCKKNLYNFGDLSGENKMTTIKFEYGVETDTSISNEMGASFIDQVKQIEATMLELLIDIFFPQCQLERSAYNNRNLRGLNIFSPSNVKPLPKNMSVTSSKQPVIIGISSKPIDMATGETCDVEGNSQDIITCLIVEGRLSLFISDMEALTDEELQVLSAVISMMNNGDLDECHPAVVKVKYIINIKEPDNNVADVDDVTNDDETITTIVATYVPWGLLGLAVGLFVMTLATRYRYYFKHKDQVKSEDTESSSGDAFVEMLDDDLVSSLSLQYTRSFKTSSSPGTKFSSNTPPVPARGKSQFSSSTTHNISKNSNTPEESNVPSQTASKPANAETTSNVKPQNDQDSQSEITKASTLEIASIKFNRLQADLVETKKSIRDLGNEHDSLKKYLEKAKVNPSSASLRKARLALLLMNRPQAKPSDVGEEVAAY